MAFNIILLPSTGFLMCCAYLYFFCITYQGLQPTDKHSATGTIYFWLKSTLWHRREEYYDFWKDCFFFLFLMLFKAYKPNIPFTIHSARLPWEVTHTCGARKPEWAGCNEAIWESTAEFPSLVLLVISSPPLLRFQGESQPYGESESCMQSGCKLRQKVIKNPSSHIDRWLSSFWPCKNPAAHPTSDNYTSLGTQVAMREEGSTPEGCSGANERRVSRKLGTSELHAVVKG